MRRLLASAVAVVLTVTAAACSVKQPESPGGSGETKEISFLTFETPNLPPSYWDAAIKRVTDKYPDIKVTKQVAPSTQGRTAYAKQLLQSGQFPDVMIAVDPAGFAEAGNLYDWKAEELKDFEF